MSHINRFKVAQKRIELLKGYDPPSDENPEIAPYGFFQGRHIIGEHTSINTGVFISALPCEALVIDDEYRSLSYVYDQLLTEFAREHGTSHELELHIMPYLKKRVESAMTYNPGGTESYLKSKKVVKDSKTSLTVLIDAGIGAARHQVLLYAYLLERLIKAGYIHGAFFLHHEPTNELEEDEGITYRTPDGYHFTFAPGLPQEDSW